MYSIRKEDRKRLTTVKAGQVITVRTGVHITYAPDRVQVLKPLPELGLHPGEIILRYMNRGEGFADVWANGKWSREFDCSFILEKNDGGCIRGCSAKVIAEGRKDWWVQVQTSQDLIGWTKVDDQFDCMDSLGGDPECDKLGKTTDAQKNGNRDR
ncbi:MAG: hypothetical protein ACRD4K_03525 [Candidatus Acidiferrales bacterium]